MSMYPHQPMPYGPQGMAAQFMGNQGFRFGQPPMQQRTPLQNIELYQVTNMDEARAAMVNPLGMTMFLNFPANEIYVKRIGNDGRGEMYTFALVQPVQENAQGNQQSNQLEIINQRLANMEAILGGLTNVQRNAEPTISAAATNATVAASEQTSVAESTTSARTSGKGKSDDGGKE